MYNMSEGAGITGLSTVGAVADPEPSGEKEAVTRTLSWYHLLTGSEAFSRGTQISHGDTKGTWLGDYLLNLIISILQSAGDSHWLSPARSQKEESRQCS